MDLPGREPEISLPSGAFRVDGDPSSVLSNVNTHQPPPAKANFHAKLFIITTQQHCTEVSEPISLGKVDR